MDNQNITPIDVAILRKFRPLERTVILINMGISELTGVCLQLHIKTKRGADRTDLINAINAALDPQPVAAPAVAAPVTEYAQRVMF